MLLFGTQAPEGILFGQFLEKLPPRTETYLISVFDTMAQRPAATTRADRSQRNDRVAAKNRGHLNIVDLPDA
jgi:hypothetical protein